MIYVRESWGKNAELSNGYKKRQFQSFDLRAIYFPDIPKKQTKEIENNRNYSTFF